MNDFPTNAQEIAQFLGTHLIGPNVDIRGPQMLDRIEPNSVVFLHRRYDEGIAKINETPNVFALVTDGVDADLTGSHALVDNARLSIARVIARFFERPHELGRIAKTAIIGKNVTLGEGVTIGEYTVIEDDVRIGDHTRIRHHCVIARGSRIGSGCVILSHSAIGEHGFGFIYDEDERLVRFPHIGWAELGDNVEIGCFNSVPRGALGPTIVEEGTKTSDFVQVAHNARVGPHCILAAYAKVGSGAVVGDHAFLGIRSTSREKLRVGRWALLGMGSVVVKDVSDGSVVTGVPARHVRKRRKEGGY